MQTKNLNLLGTRLSAALSFVALLGWPAVPLSAANAPANWEFRGAAPAPTSPLALWYRAPAKNWSAEALPLGNGRLGCMVFGGVDQERIQFNEDSLWTGDQNPKGDYDSMGAYQNFGDLLITLDSVTHREDRVVEDYRRELDLSTGVAKVGFNHRGVTYTREIFASKPDDVIVVRWTASRPGAISATIRLRGAHGEPTQAAGDGLRFAATLPNGLDYAAGIGIKAKGGTAVASDGALRVQQCDEVVLYLAARTSYAMDYSEGWRGSKPGPRVDEELAAAAKREWQNLVARHTDDFRSLFARVNVNLGRTDHTQLELPTDLRLKGYRAGRNDPELEQILFQYGRYLLISCSRRPGLPANLQGLWNDSNNPPWHSDYHSNINIQMNYWLAEPANLGECALPFFDLVVAMVEPSRAATQASFGKVRGWTARTSHNIFGGHGWQWNIPASAWYAQHFWEHFAFTRDTNFLREVAYPVMKEICQYWEDQLKKLPDGSLVVTNGWSPEHGPREDGIAHDQQIVWDLFTNYLEGAGVLGVNPEYQATIAGLRDRLVGPKIGRWGQLQEWMADRDDPKDQHRHTSHLFAVYPGRQISQTKTPDFAKAAAVSLESRGTSGDSRRSWTWPWRCAMWARLHEPEKCYAMIRGLLDHNVLPNLLGDHPPMQMDGNFGITAAMCEMFVQSHAGEIELLPALPKEWPEGEFSGLCARGAFTVDAKWKASTLIEARITAQAGGALVVRCGSRTAQFKTQAGEVLVLDADLKRR